MDDNESARFKAGLGNQLLTAQFQTYQKKNVCRFLEAELSTTESQLDVYLDVNLADDVLSSEESFEFERLLRYRSALVNVLENLHNEA